jgi:tetratricopeptide (TPR) repeat protein
MIERLQDHLRIASDDVNAYALLANAYLQRARETGDPSYYGRAAAVLKGALNRDPRNVEALIAQGSLALARHDFHAALALGEQARALSPTVPRIYGVIADAQVELSMYAEAVATVQRMVDLRPDLSSYSRVSYLRELHGDLPGAIKAMEAAVAAGGPSAENTQWVRVQLGNLHFARGELERAEQYYRSTLAVLPDYVPALAAQARIESARGRQREAIALYRQAVDRMPLPEYVIALGDVYARLGDREEAQRQYDLVRVIDSLQSSNGVNTDLELALFFADHDLELPASLAKARAAYAARPSIHAADVLAWTLYKLGRYDEAGRYSAEALRLGTEDSLKLFHAGMIAHARGRNDDTRHLLRRALDLQPHFSTLYACEARTTLRQLDSGATKGDN